MIKTLYEHLYSQIKGSVGPEAISFISFFIVHTVAEIIVFSYIIDKVLSFETGSIEKLLVGCGVYLITIYIYRFYQDKLLSKIKPLCRKYLVELILNSNKNKYTNKNYSKYSSHIGRLADKLFLLMEGVTFYYVPYILSVLIIGVFLYKYNIKNFLLFIVCNIVLVVVLFLKLDNILDDGKLKEDNVLAIEKDQLDILVHLDKIISRNLVNYEMVEFNKKTKEQIDISYRFFTKVRNKEFILKIIPLVTFLYIIYNSYKVKDPNLSIYITIFFIFKGKYEDAIHWLVDIFDVISKIRVSKEFFEPLVANFKVIEPVYKDLDYNKIIVKDVYYKYGDNNIYNGLNMVLDFTNHHTYGIYGKSGKGKSTLCKLLIGLFKPTGGKILLDGIDYSNISTDQLQRDITYITQDNKLFDRNIEDNIKWGCSNTECDNYLSKIVESKNIQDVFGDKLESIYKKNNGFLGENISGGQRQIINVINGLIVPSKILILDEPTNNLDDVTKSRLIRLLSSFKSYKKGILIISHDKDIEGILDKKLII